MPHQDMTKQQIVDQFNDPMAKNHREEMNKLNEVTRSTQTESCKRCGKKYQIDGVYICPCIDLTDGGGYTQFSTPEDAQKALSLISNERKLLLEEVKKLDEMQQERFDKLDDVVKKYSAQDMELIAVHMRNKLRDDLLSALTKLQEKE